MTTIVPEFIFALLEDEIRKIQVQLLKRVANEYLLEEDELIASLLPAKPVHVTTERVKIFRRAAPKSVAEEDTRCQARIWNRGRGGQCTRKHGKDDKLCTQHSSILEKRGNLKYGWINEPPSSDIFGSGSMRKALHITGL